MSAPNPGLEGYLSPAKINLALHVGPARADGYHPVDTLCVFVDAGDRIEVVPDRMRTTFAISGPYADDLAEAAADNLVVKALSILQRVRAVPPAKIFLEKRVPPASGVAGGTSNGAATLDLMNQSLSARLSDASLVRLAIGLGADGPVCMAHRVMAAKVLRARGIGETVEAGPAVPPVAICLANPGVGVSTGRVFHAFDAAPPAGPLDLRLPARVPSLTALADWVRAHRNDLAPVARALEPRIALLEDAMAAQPGCAVARMSGSGATVFGLFPSREAAARAAKRLASGGYWTASGPLLSGVDAGRSH